MDPISPSNAGAVVDAGPDVLAACALSSVPGVGASTLGRIADRFHSLREAVDEVLARLSPRYRRAIQLRVLEDLPRAECARRMETTLGNFEVLVLRALRAFRAEWVLRHGERWEEP